MPSSKTVVIDNIEYTAEELSSSARKLVVGIKAADQEIRRVGRQLSMMKDARATYAAALAKALPKKEAAAKGDKKK